MTYDIVLAGVGGQGVLSIAAIIAREAQAEGLAVRQSEVHGMSQRGGAVSAQLRISGSKVLSDLVPSGGADMILSMELLESLRYASYLKPDGVLVTAADSLVNIPNYPEASLLVASVKSFPCSALVEAADLARAAGSARAVNMVMVGAASRFIPLRPEGLKERIAELFSAKGQSVVDANLAAFAAGREAAEGRDASATSNLS
jgi:Pyruvate:ferredoxin oxidoreductase and related 2-oxoacid:ferredoxin oxidoreductases, gamma subunit